MGYLRLFTHHRAQEREVAKLTGSAGTCSQGQKRFGPCYLSLKLFLGSCRFSPFEDADAAAALPVTCEIKNNETGTSAMWSAHRMDTTHQAPRPLSLSLITAHSGQGRLADSLVLWFHIISWGVPLGITVAAVCLQKIGFDASEVSVGWCWVSIQAPDHVLWMLLTGKIWEFTAYLTLPVLYILIKKHIHRAHAALSEYRPILASSAQSQSRSSMADKKMTLIPIIFIALRIWSSLRFLLMLVGSSAGQNPLLVTLHGIGNTFQGAANCIMFVLCTKPVRSRLLAAACCCCCRCAERRSADTSIQETTSTDAPPRQENAGARRRDEDC
ncbi:hypothetical protein SKAU_G00173050 [Synaphobranchus kaupii]|uniref:G protein-coupled receptor 157 n=1 Tax=Synaphobranchus kaupii TaxID=118154 RepID=A0A9Q1J0W6_SYNKA|nr:hypothetical protein SKAU_G00173050 [Synaphobranchus kaupii]